MSNTAPLGSLQVSRLSLGGNVFGWTADADTSVQILDAYLAGGGNFVDTADLYAGGQSETIIGDWVASRGNRDDVVIASKVGHQRNAVHQGLAPATIRAATDESLRRLRTDHIDLLYTHMDDESVEVGEIITTLDELVQAGKVREIGASNISPARLEASLAFSEAEGKARYVALQPHYNLVSRDTYEGELQDVAAKWNLGVAPYFALAMGFLTGKYRPGATVDSPRADRASQYLGTERGTRVLAALEQVAAAHGVAPASVALAWLDSRPQVVAPIASARNLEQLQPLLAALDLTLTAAELAELTAASE
ncbi:NADP-dependent aryl-alcohol dehydrogenase [Microtetraspora sp. NBRC 13810]|uniref:aldo/keto reductase n=1 Tax=Microtetraspora sp. NBRC 13810 TaxID=3030990 RepID=UPI0024A35A50|nr:aldo/keto reductase [Microtetraspora sp. NBRC 13810]GLW07560.1 NADP-dependent aryl-alcohol dehydrogenase [Microtetraspora sp. NBRC 13810]